MARGNNKMRMYAEPPLYDVLGKTVWLAGALVLLAGVLGWRIGGWHWGLAAVALLGAVVARHYRHKYVLEARHPTEGELDADGNRHGRWLWRFRDGTIGREAEFRHGRLHGTDVWYYPDGTKHQEAHFRNDELYGPFQQWDRNGQLDCEAEVRANLAHGRCVQYERDGSRIEFWCEDGDLHGPTLGYRADGTRCLEVFCEHGKRHGAYREWHDNGQLSVEVTYASGELDGVATHWYPNGKRQSTGAYVCSHRHGLWTWWHENGERWLRGEYKWGARHGLFTEWNPDGTERQTSEYVAGYELSPSRFPFGIDAQHNTPGRMRWLVRALVVLLVLAVVRDAHLVVTLVLLMMTIGIHELGHLLAAKVVGIPICQFRVGLGPVWYRHSYRGTAFEWSLIPLIGFVAEYAMRESEWQHARQVLRARRKGLPVPEYPEIDPHEPRKPGSHLVSSPRRLMYLLGGVTFNLLTAWLALWAYNAGVPAEPGAPSSFVQTCRDMADVTRGSVGAIQEELAVYFRLETYTEYQPSILAVLSGTSRGMFAEAIEESTDTGRGEATASDDADPPPKTERALTELSSAEIGSALVHYGRSVLFLVFAVHLGIAIFNLLPIAPLDGYHCVATIFEAALGRYAGFVLWPLSLVGYAFLGFLLLGSSYLLLRDLVMVAF